MKSVTMTRSSASSSRPGNYRIDLTITSSNDITPALFVKQRIILLDGTNDDTFVTIANPSQIEDIPLLSSIGNDFYFRENTVSLVSSDPDLLAQIVDSIIADIQLTLIQATDLDNLTVQDTISIDTDTVTIDQA